MNKAKLEYNLAITIALGGDRLLSRQELEKFKSLDITDVNQNDLQELKEVNLYSDLPVQERLKLFLCQIGNPYCFKVNGTPVQISFSGGPKTLDEALNNYLTNRNDCDKM
ncbi:MAG: hypothetical protein FWH26_06745 [Oscillospiraceae bacterium]|nr:hypothetical protein [Oscillospiraceae bacterium]